ncbi:MAG: cyclase family protein [Opitutaceae bacterium]|nr:cyclase family protein [Opitutaceae bacterium]
MPRIIDLTLSFRPGMRGFKSKVAKTKTRDGWNARTLTLYSHAGTHMDAPFHFVENGGTIDQLDLNKCVGPCHVIAIEGLEPKALINIEHLGSVADTIRPGDRIILKTGWSQYVDNSLTYRDGLPRISEALARWFVEKQVVFIGVEPPSIADVNNIHEVTLIHEILLSAEIVIAEGLCNLDQLSQDIVELVALPLKPEGGDGCPARIIAIER